MSKLDSYFLKFTDKLAYLDLKDTASYGLLNDVPLPIYIDDMSENILKGSMANKIELETILEAMIINIGIDKDFKYINEYIEILEKYLKDIGGFAATKALTYAEKKPDKALLLTRGGYIINPLNKYNAYNYARLLWPRSFEASKDYQDDFVKEALTILQNIISYDEDFPLSYYELGNIYTNLGQYVKARSYYDNALMRTEDAEAKDEIRRQIDLINDNAEIEESLYFIGKGNYDEAIKKLTKLLSNKSRADAYYYLGVSYQNIGQYENSILAFQNALDKGGEFRELYNDYAVSLYAAKRENDALDIISQGLELFPEDPRMVYNSIQINLSLGKLSQAKKDIENLLTYDDLSDELINNLMIIKNQFNI
ncbi:MAG: tetratricopeptide repeat protein [Peptoniphilaceae bacterium]|nr:tetratricopeptide repeat protein [Peptoniphilaceae bacterium]MDY6018461.1 tetratricopeptide repeat protein [Anaerococcus sp.]